MDGGLLTVRNLSKSFGGVWAARDVSFEVRPGQIHGLIGPNGAGKTTIVNLISGEYVPNTGSVEISGVNVSHLSPHARSRRGLGRTFQTPHVFDQLSAEDNVMVALESKSSIGVSVGSGSSRRGSVQEILDDFSLEDVARVRVRDLPYGRQKQLQMAIAFAANPTVVLLDEPIAGLSQEEKHDVIEVIRRRRAKTTMLLIEHQMDVVMPLCDSITVLSGGEVIADGTPEEIRSNKIVREAYLGVPEDESTVAAGPQI